jgi:formylglycine-generating enzyme required for sulfatase activity
MQLPFRFGKYELQVFLGGGMARVFKARDTVLGRTVAVKILTPEGVADASTRARFLAEAKMSASLVHDNIIRIFDYGEEQGWPFIVMEFLTGCDLRTAIRENRTGGTESKLRLAIQGARALQHVHEAKLIHRDIKPDNLHVDPSGRVRLMDFGIAKSEDLSLTKTGFQVGTPYYMSPEQVNGDRATERTDIYSYGMVLYELFTGVRAIEGETIPRIFYAILNEPVRVEVMRERGAPEPVIALVARMTAKDPAQRPASFLEVIAELERLITPTAPAAEPPAAVPGVSAAKKLIPVLIGAIVVLTVLTVWVVQKRQQRAAGGPAKPLPGVRQDPAGEMVLVPGGAFKWGGQAIQATLPPFYIDKTEVTNAQFRRYCEAKGRPLPPGLAEAAPGLPVVNVAFVEANSFCTWAGKHLPLPMEWEKAARGTDGRLYPWGNTPDPSKAVVQDNPSFNGKPSLQPADSMPKSASPSGALNMLGNVWEWIDETGTPTEQSFRNFAFLNPQPTATEPWYHAKGGAFDVPVRGGVLNDSITVPARFAAPDIGFRCASAP